MTACSRTTPHRLALIALALTATLLAGCGGSADDTSSGAPAGQAQATPVDSEATADGDADGDGDGDGDGADGGLPTCDEVKAALGSAVEQLVELDGSDNGVTTGADGPELGCAWHTKEVADASTDLDQYGGISIGVSRDPDYTEDSMEPLGWTVDDPRVSAADAWALKVGGGYDPADQLDATGVQVVKDGIVVVLTSGGVVLQDVPELASLTNEWALGAGVDVLELMD
jgi:hypothetical protein